MQITGLLWWRSRWASPASAGGHRVWPRGLEGSHMPRSTKPTCRGAPNPGPQCRGTQGLAPGLGGSRTPRSRSPGPQCRGTQGLTPGPGRVLHTEEHRAQAPQLLSLGSSAWEAPAAEPCAATPDACMLCAKALQQEKALQWEDPAPPLRPGPTCHNWRKPTHSNSVQPKIIC